MRLLLAREVAELLRVTENRVYELAARKLLPCIRMGRQLRFEESQLLAWIERGGAGLEAPSSPPSNAVAIPMGRRA
jgi:excisionase family DNA binding protein